jgi:TolB-like protein/Tfp pilus assembly protein PilF
MVRQRARGQNYFMNKLFTELRRRNIFRVAGVYAVVGWILMQVAGTLENSLNLPDWFDSTITATLLIGFPIAMLLAWAFEMTPEGVKRTEEVDEGESVTAKTGRMLDIVIITGLVLVAALVLWQGTRSSPTPFEAAKNAAPQGEAAPIIHASNINNKSVAVLPFENRSKNEEDAYFADGVQDGLLTRLAKISALDVISRTSVMGYRDTNKRIPDIAKELGVAVILEGAVQRAGKRVRITVQLIDGATDKHLWAQDYDRELTTDNLFEIQAEITRIIARALEAVLTGADKQVLEGAPITQSLAAYDAYIRARLLAAGGDSVDSLNAAIKGFDSAINIDPDFAAAYAGKADAQLDLYWSFTHNRDLVSQAEQALQRARILAPNAPETLIAEGYYQYYGLLDYNRANAAFDRALVLASGNAEAWEGKGFVARRMGRFDAAIAALERAQRLDPKNIQAYFELAQTYAYLGRFDEGHRIMALATALNPRPFWLVITNANNWSAEGKPEQAWQASIMPIDKLDRAYFSRRAHHAVNTRQAARIHDALDGWPEAYRQTASFPELFALSRARALMVLGRNDEAQKLLGEIKARLETMAAPYPAGWAANTLYFPVELPGLMGDLAGVRAAVLDFEANVKPDAWAERDYFKAIARAYANAGDAASAFDYMEKLAKRYGPAAYLQFTILPAFDTIRDRPRYLALKTSYEVWAENNTHE